MTKIVDEKKVEKTIEKLHAIFNKAKLTPREILIAYGNLGYHLGASMAGFTDKGPDIGTLKRFYYADPTVDVGLMLQGLMITTWEEDFERSPKLSKLAEQNSAEERKVNNVSRTP